MLIKRSADLLHWKIYLWLAQKSCHGPYKSNIGKLWVGSYNLEACQRSKFWSASIGEERRHLQLLLCLGRVCLLSVGVFLWWFGIVFVFCLFGRCGGEAGHGHWCTVVWDSQYPEKSYWSHCSQIWSLVRSSILDAEDFHISDRQILPNTHQQITS